MVKLRLIWILVLVMFGLVISPAHAQTRKTRAQIEKEKDEIQKKLLEFDQILKKTAESKKVSVGQLNALNQQLQNRINYINTLNGEMRLLETEIRETESRIKNLEKELKTLKEEYSGMVYTSSKLNQGMTMTAFVFSSETFKQFYMRLKYLKQYSDARKKQVEQIENVTEELVGQRRSLEGKKKDMQAVIQQENQQKQQLDKAKKDQQNIVNSLNQQEQELKKQIAAAKKQQENLNRMLREIIAEDRRKAEAAAKSSGATTTRPSGSSIPMTPEAAALSSSFAGNRGKLPWPVESGFVSRPFGTHPHPTLKGITEDNDGIDIQTTPNASVRAVFDGEVIKIGTIPGYGGTIVIKHGEYYTMYSKLKVISVKSGEKVKAKQVLGQVYTNREGVAEVHFETWKGLEPMNPSIWLAGR
ncbi:murein hydrolase activator EnvC family protein [Cecembia calidifontis]|jgi:septal ring factor EnvC (AmiA/AmiB activator)|uniref:Septal ring factor EnvC (AmiA/AmiB activator) n=1 Tax=Cecembia calidifontis TaxID=1187080 RepID=A0A4Q7P9F4_9BACT|nr:peptidoglycan DD-metalloendopeptidase family protein [Cecembia calidifontis]RZS96150.1 septal ring factor EnvC (AmiA/AmiB activator) [Cecembia calidifontis]